MKYSPRLKINRMKPQFFATGGMVAGLQGIDTREGFGGIQPVDIPLFYSRLRILSGITFMNE